ncbi:MAG: adenylate/guanylate cyclase domain-containing protein, partial [Deinococcus sp.]|nr:adenylate/guanylate cyclase domain-containing protein [Deinococcus sp.]
RRRAEQLNGRGLGWDMKVGISIDTGVAIVGNIGSQRRMEYTVVGDVVNSASRVLQAGVRGMPNGILIGQRTFEQVCHAIAAREGEPLSVPGRSGRLRVYEVLGPKSGVQ